MSRRGEHASAVTNIIGRWVKDNSTASYVESFHDDLDVLREYLTLIYGKNTKLVMDGFDSADAILATIGDLPEALTFPFLSGLDPRSPETGEWAAFAIHRSIEIHPDAYMPLSRFDAPAWNTRQLCERGVSLAYVKALDVTYWGEKLPLERIFQAHAEGLAVEYAQEIIYGGSA
jgi:hypothetical protein